MYIRPRCIKRSTSSRNCSRALKRGWEPLIKPTKYKIRISSLLAFESCQSASCRRPPQRTQEDIPPPFASERSNHRAQRQNGPESPQPNVGLWNFRPRDSGSRRALPLLQHEQTVLNSPVDSACSMSPDPTFITLLLLKPLKSERRRDGEKRNPTSSCFEA